LRVALGDVDAAHAGVPCETAPAFARPRRSGVLAGKVKERALHEVAHHAGVRTVRQDRRRPPAVAKRERRLAQRVVRALRERFGLVGVAARPGLDAGIDVERAELAAEADDVDRRDLDRHVHDEPAAREERRELAAQVLPRERRLHEAHTLELGQPPVAVVRSEHDQLVARRTDVPEDQRQHALADRPEPDHHDRAGELRVDGVLRHGLPPDPPRACTRSRRGARRPGGGGTRGGR
jgi:hypothetical protein